MQHRAGILKTNFSGDMQYKSFFPKPLPPDSPIEMDGDMVALLVRANKAISLLNGISENIPNINLFVSHYVRKEALMSSQIEGTQATLEDVFNPMINENVNQDVSDVVNYVKAVEFALDKLNELPLCNRLIKETHAILMQSVRGKDKQPGEFRKSQNWIGGEGSTLKDARYIPPNIVDMDVALGDLEQYLNENEELDYLIKIALIHYQFETIHPFLDGNGRIGRVLITLYLMQNKVLNSPALYISYFLKKNRVEYYDRMTEVRNKGHYEQWIKFFLSAIAETAEDAVEKIKALSALIETDKKRVAELKTGRAILKVYEYLLSNPIIEIQKTADSIGVTFKTTGDCVKRLCDLEILEQTSGKQRYRIFSYKEYLDILKDGC